MTGFWCEAGSDECSGPVQLLLWGDGIVYSYVREREGVRPVRDDSKEAPLESAPN